MENLEKLTIFGTHGTGRRQNKYKAKTKKKQTQILKALTMKKKGDRVLTPINDTIS